MHMMYTKLEKAYKKMIDKVAEQEKRLSSSSPTESSSPKFFKMKKKQVKDINAALNERLSKLLIYRL